MKFDLCYLLYQTLQTTILCSVNYLRTHFGKLQEKYRTRLVLHFQVHAVSSDWCMIDDEESTNIS